MITLSKEDYERYSRHIILPSIGVEGQLKLKEAKVIVVGAGGLGVPVLMYLAAAGVGEIGIIDFDKIERSNLQRQVIYKDKEVTQSKAWKAHDFIKAQNPSVVINVFETWIDSSNALDILTGYDLIIDGTDNFPTRYLLNDASVLLGIPYVYGSIYRFEGQVSVFNYNDGPNYRDLFPEPPAPEIVPNCSEGGVFGVLPGIIGSMQALEAIKILTGAGEILSGKLLTVDTLTNQYRTFRFSKRVGRKDIQKLIDYEQFCNPNKDNIDLKNISPKELENWKREGKKFQLIDVREPYEYEITSMGGELMPKSQISQYISQIRRDIPVVVHCRSGKRSSDVIIELQREHKYENLVNLDGGILKYGEDVDRSIVKY